MSAVSGTATTLTTIGIREDLEDTIYRVAPSKTPFSNNVGSAGKQTNTYHEWQLESLTPAAANAQLEGDDSPSFASSEVLTTRVGNYAQIFRKVGIVSGTDEVVKKAGRSSELNRQKVLKGIELRTDMELAWLSNVASNQQSGGTPRHSGGLRTWLTSNTSLGSGGSTTGFATGVTTAATPGTTRTLTEAVFKAVRATAFGNGASPNQAYMSISTKQTMSTFAGIASIRVDAKPTEQATIVGAADVYIDEVGKVVFIPHQYAVSNAVLLVDPEMVGVATLRGMFTDSLAQTGDADKFQIIAEKSLVVRNEKAHAMILAV